MATLPTHIEHVDPILRVTDMARALKFYVDVLGFEAADWGDDQFGYVGLGGHGLYLSVDQGLGGAWVWVGVGDARALHRLYSERGARIILPPTNFPWALEMRLEDPDGNVLRFGSDPDE